MAVFCLIEAKGYRCLKDVSQELKPFEILVGANASGKSTFLDVVEFLSDFVQIGLDRAVELRTSNFHDLVWGRDADGFVLKVGVDVPPSKRFGPADGTFWYRAAIRLDKKRDRLGIDAEDVQITGGELPASMKGNYTRLRKEIATQSSYQDFNGSYSILNSSPPSYPRLGELFINGIRPVRLDPSSLSGTTSPGRGNPKTITGANLPWQIAELSLNKPRLGEWLAHIRTALPDIRTIDSVLREEDKHRYVVVEYENGVRVPSWVLSEGTLRLLALTILAYLPGFHGVYLIEEPENGVHPMALETIYQSLSSVYDAQVLVASHSPVLLSMARPDQILCFSKTPDGTKIVRGSDHPALKEWQGEVSLGTMVASGILG